MKNNNYAPILIPTLNRYTHFINCVESLKKNPWAKYTDLYIALDYPPSDKYYDGYTKISSYLDAGVEGFFSINIIKRTQNYGSVKNTLEAFKELFKKYDRLIYSEDDNVFSPCFIEFMDKCLDYFYDDESVFAINGYSCPTEWYNDGSNVVASECCFSAWGYGMWKHKNQPFLELYTLKKLRNICSDKRKIEALKNKSPRSFCYLLNTVLSLNFSPNDVVMQNYMLLENKRCVIPRITKVRNMGFDGSGIHGASDKDPDLGYATQYIDENENFTLEIPNGILENHSENIRIIDEILPASKKFLARSNLVWHLIRILHPKLFFLIDDILYKLWRKFKHYLAR